ncbi:phosphoglycerate mutase 1 [Sesbania bispinosa]|nr:phosphoglycerate mutase 1 [Sesbania bispinosa]
MEGPKVRLNTLAKRRPYDGRNKLPLRKENRGESSGNGHSRGEGGSEPELVSFGLPKGVPIMHDIDDGLQE